jgi:putative transposase
VPWSLERYHRSGQSHFVTFSCYHRKPLFLNDWQKGIFEEALERIRRTYHLYVYGYVVMPEHVHLLLSEPQTTTPLNQRMVEWGTLNPDVTLADALKSLKQGCISTTDRERGRTFLAKAVLRLEPPQPSTVWGETGLYPPQPRGARIVVRSGRMAMEQFSSLCDRSQRSRRDRIGMDGQSTGTSRRKTSSRHPTTPLKPTEGLNGAPIDFFPLGLT